MKQLLKDLKKFLDYYESHDNIFLCTLLHETSYEVQRYIVNNRPVRPGMIGYNKHVYNGLAWWAVDMDDEIDICDEDLEKCNKKMKDIRIDFLKKHIKRLEKATMKP